MCKDDRALNPEAVLVVVKGTDTDINGNDGDDDAEWGGRLVEMSKSMDVQLAKADARAALQIADLKKELKKEIKDATDRADANMDTIRALLDEMRAGGRRGDGVGGDAAVEEKAG